LLTKKTIIREQIAEEKLFLWAVNQHVLCAKGNAILFVRVNKFSKAVKRVLGKEM